LAEAVRQQGGRLDRKRGNDNRRHNKDVGRLGGFVERR
jgi:hypothetical protein